MFTIEDFENAGIEGIADILSANAGVEWVKENTTIEVDDDLDVLPICAKLFIRKFTEIGGKSSGVASESISGLSQSFAVGQDNSLIWDLAHNLLGKYLKSRFYFRPMPKRWD